MSPTDRRFVTAQPESTPSKKVALISLGCPKNLVDSEHMVGLLASAGFEVTTSLEEAEAVVVNTCAFIRSAVEEAEGTIRDVLKWKTSGRVRKVIVTGCLPQRFSDSLLDRFSGVDAFLGVDGFPKITEILNGEEEGIVAVSSPSLLPDHRFPRVIATPNFRAYLKLAEGCSNHCTYCLIPQIRGELRSRSIASILIEARRLAEQGVKEITLIAQDTTAYGQDLRNGTTLEELLRRLARVEGICWIRILYAHPRGLREELVSVLAEEEKVVPYLYLPIQHVSDRVLKAMGRRVSGQEIRRGVWRLRERIPDLALRTTIMVGFPGETESEFQELKEFIREVEFDHLGVFGFSPEPGTKAAGFSDQVPDSLREERRRELLELQTEISRRRNESRIGGDYEVLIEGYDPDQRITIGRIPGQAPEIDGVTRIYRDDLVPGEFRRIKVVDALIFDLIGKLV